MKKQLTSGFTLVELLIYSAVFSITAVVLTGILVMISNVQVRENASFEVTRQLQFVTQKIQYAIRDASMVDAVYESSNASNPCTDFCAIRLRVTDPALDPTIISSDAGGVYIQEGSSPKVALTSSSVKINSLKFNKIDNPGGVSTVSLDLALVYEGGAPGTTIAKNLSSSIAHVSAATFDSDLLPDTTDSRSIGGSSLKWRDMTLSSGMTISGPSGVGEYAGVTMSRGITHGTSSLYQYYVTGSPDKYGTHFDVGGTPILYLEADSALSNRRGYILNGNFGIGTATPAYTLHVKGGQAFFDTATNASPLVIARQQKTSNFEEMKIGADDTNVYFHYVNDESSSSVKFRLQNTDTETGGGASPSDRTVLTLKGDSSNGYVGINNTNPAYEMDVSGSLRITGTPYRAGGDIAWQVPSDMRLKNVSGKYTSGLRDILSLKPIRYHYRDNTDLRLDSSKEYIGVLAQDVKDVIPDAISNDQNGYLSLNITPIFWSVVNAIYELANNDNDLKERIEKQDLEIQMLKAELMDLKGKLND